jgi:hypothetical protein
LLVEEYFVAKTVSIADDLYELLAFLARPFLDKEPADVIRRLAEQAAAESEGCRIQIVAPDLARDLVGRRAPRERGAIVDLDGTTIRADTVPDLCAQVMNYMFQEGHGDAVMRLAPYKTSAQRYLFAKTPRHPNGNEFFVPLKCHGLYVETHKNYKTSVTQLARFTSICGVSLTYKGP